MKEFDYSSSKKTSLSPDPSYWLVDMGLRETRWILDTRWIIRTCEVTYNEWLENKDK